MEKHKSAGMAGGADEAEQELAAEDQTDAGALGTLRERISAEIGQAREAGVEEQDILSALEEAADNIEATLP